MNKFGVSNAPAVDNYLTFLMSEEAEEMLVALESISA